MSSCDYLSVHIRILPSANHYSSVFHSLVVILPLVCRVHHLEVTQCHSTSTFSPRHLPISHSSLLPSGIAVGSDLDQLKLSRSNTFGTIIKDEEEFTSPRPQTQTLIVNINHSYSCCFFSTFPKFKNFQRCRITHLGRCRGWLSEAVATLANFINDSTEPRQST